METVPSERALLMYLISKFQLLDPDIIIVSNEVMKQDCKKLINKRVMTCVCSAWNYFYLAVKN